MLLLKFNTKLKLQAALNGPLHIWRLSGSAPVEARKPASLHASVELSASVYQTIDLLVSISTAPLSLDENSQDFAYSFTKVLWLC